MVGNKLSLNETQLKQQTDIIEAERMQRKALHAEVQTLRTELSRTKETQSLQFQQLKDSLTNTIQERDRNIGQLKNEIERLENLVERTKSDLSKETAQSLKKDQQIKL